jgi:acetoin utilization deacetylase AcuC-like enzyme
VTAEQLRAVHPAGYVEEIRAVCEAGGGAFDPDTIASAGSYDAALHAAGGACAMAEALVGGETGVGFSALRPPGHHAEPSVAMGFCLFNNVAVAARHALDSLGLERVFVFDWDVHHGNGTNDIFAGSRDVLFASIHQMPLYPGTGPLHDVGRGEGEGYSINLPVPPGSGDDVWLSLVEHVVVPAARAFKPQLVLVSAGFDAHRDDPLASCRVTEAGFAGMTASLRRACDAIGAPLGLVLEGGYDTGALSHSMAALMPVLVADSAPAAEAVERHPLAVRTLERLGRYWPGLSASSGRSAG